MGTRSLTKVLDSKGEVLVCMCRQYDGYQSGHGQELKDFLDSKVIVNGFQNDRDESLANGMGCLAAQLVCNFKVCVGGFYLYPVNSDTEYIDFIYTVYPQSGSHTPELMIKCEFGFNSGKVLYEGLVSDYAPTDEEGE